MKEKQRTLRIFNFSNPLSNTEILSVLGDKFKNALPFKWEFISDYKSADVIMWDGVITPKNKYYVEKIISDSNQKIILLVGESVTLLKESPVARLVEMDRSNIVELFGWTLIPEEILAAFQTCYQKLNYV